MAVDFFEVEVALRLAKGIAWDTCHKIYVLMDNEQIDQMRGYGYGDANDPDSLITKEQMNADEMLATVKKWYEESCGLKFVEAVSTVDEGKDANEGFEILIEQGAEDNEECDECGERGCYGACEDSIIDDEEEDEDY